MSKQNNEIIKVEALSSPTSSLESMRWNTKLFIPNCQRASIETTIRRIRDKSTKRFSCKKINDEYFSLKRIR